MRRHILKRNLILLAVLAAALVLFRQTLPGSRSALQLSFDQWLEQKENFLSTLASQPSQHASPNEDSNMPQMPELRLELAPGTNVAAVNLKLPPAAEVKHAQQILRLLQLMREADVFSLSQQTTSNSLKHPRVTMQVKDNGQTFISQFNASAIKDNLKAQLLLRLFNEYAQAGQAETFPDENS